MNLSVNFIGCGHVGRTLGYLLAHHSTCTLLDVCTQHLETAQDAVAFMGQGRAISNIVDMRPANLWIIATRDADIAFVAKTLSTLNQPPSLVIHLSGAITAQEGLHDLIEKGWSATSVHCCLSFSDPDRSTVQFPGTLCTIEESAALPPSQRTLLWQFFTQIGGRCCAIASDKKFLYHSGAVFVSNFVTVLASMADNIWHYCGLDDDSIHISRQNLLTHITQNIATMGAEHALTGPAKREDIDFIHRQSEAIRTWNPEYANAYDALMKLGLQLAKHR